MVERIEAGEPLPPLPENPGERHPPDDASPGEHLRFWHDRHGLVWDYVTTKPSGRRMFRSPSHHHNPGRRYKERSHAKMRYVVACFDDENGDPVELDTTRDNYCPDGANPITNSCWTSILDIFR